MLLFLFFFIFFFSSRRRHTRYIGDWSSDVCSSDLPVALQPYVWKVSDGTQFACSTLRDFPNVRLKGHWVCAGDNGPERSEERRVGKECRSRGRTDRSSKKNRTNTSTAAHHTQLRKQ